MAADLPGFYFDASKGKYFRIQPNNVAPVDSKYSRQAVTAERKAQTETKKAQQHEEFLDRNRLKRSSYLRSPCGLLLRRQLGDVRTTSANVVRNSYASGLRPRTVFRNLQSDVFAVEKASKQLFTLSSPRGGRGREFCSSKHTTVESHDGGENCDEGDAGIERATYPRDFTVPIYDTAQELRCVEPINKDLVVWVTREVEAGDGRGAGGMLDYVQGIEGSRVHFSRRRDWGWPGEEYGEWGTSVLRAGSMIWDVKARGDSRRILLAEDGALLVCDVEAGIREGMWGVKQVCKDQSAREWMCVAWQGENIAISGDRAGGVWLLDLRIGGGAVRRARCPWAVSAVRSVGREGLLVWGLEGGRLLDLRFNQKDRIQNSKRKTTTRPAIVFDSGDSWKQKRYGMGWDYDEQLGLVASASTDLHKRHRVGLWDVATGRMLKNSPLAEKHFPSPVTCLQMVDLEDKGGLKSLLIACSGKIQAWEV